MAAPHILARTLQEAHAFARDELGLGRGYYRVVMSPSTIKAVRGTKVYLVPGWERRYDRFAMKSALRWCHLEIVDVAKQRDEDEPDGLQPPGVQTVLEFEIAGADEAMALLTSGLEKPDDDTASDKAPKRRRRRCKECGVLVEPDEVEAHAAAHADQPALAGL